MKARQLQPLAFALVVLIVLGGCRASKQATSKGGPIAEEVIERVVHIVRGSGDNILVPQEEAALRAAIRAREEASNSINSLGDLVGSKVSVNDIRDAAPRAESLRNIISGELNHIARNIDSSDAIDLGAAVVEAHCGGLKQELALANGVRSTDVDYILYFAIALGKSRIPPPPAKQIAAVADDLVKVARYLHAKTINDEAARRAYVKEICKIP